MFNDFENRQHWSLEGGGALPVRRPPFFTCKDYMVGIDMYGVRPTLEVDGKRQYKTCWGAFVSGLCLVFIIIFVLAKLVPEGVDEAFGGGLAYDSELLQFTEDYADLNTTF